MNKAKGIVKQNINETNNKIIQKIYDAINKDDSLELSELLKHKIKNYNENYLFTAVDAKAKKCFDILLENNANKECLGRTYYDGEYCDVSPIELACMTNQIDFVRKLVNNGVSLKNRNGENILYKYGQNIYKDDKEEIKQLRKQFINKCKDSSSNLE